MRNIAFLFATSALVIVCVVPATAQAGQVVDSADDAAKSESRKNAESEDARLDADTRSQSSDTASGDVVVTGSRIVNPNLASAAPVQAISAQEIKLSAAVNIEDVLNRLPQVVPYNPQADDEGNGTARVSLRNIGGSGAAALVLLDGQRLGGQVATDVNAIPPALVQRVDVLTGGAAAVYGPDALTGVVNFILKRDFKGVQVDANYGFFNHMNRRNIVTATAQSRGFDVPLGLTNDGARATINVAAGTRLFDDRLSLTGYFSYRHTDNLPYTSRSTQACHLLQAGIDGALSCDSTIYSRFGYIYNVNDGTPLTNARDGDSRVLRPYRNTQNATTDRQNRMDSSYQMLRANERYNAGGFLSFKATDWAELYGSFMYTRNTSQGTYNPATLFDGMNGDGGYQLNCDNPLMSAQQAQVLCGAQAGTSATVPIDFGYRFARFPTRTIDYRQVYNRATVGVRGDFAEAWHYDIGGVWAKANISSAINRNWDPSAANVAKALNVVSVNGVPTCVSKVNGTDPNCVPLDIFRGNSGDPAAYNYIFQYAPNGPTRNVSYFADVQANLSGDLGHYGIRSPLASDGVQISLSAEFRRDVATRFTSADYNSIIQGTPNPSSSSRGKQTAKELAGEIQIPLIQDQSWTHLLGFSGGYRASNYDTSTRTFFSTWKLEGTWAPVEDIRFRVARNFASRAPNVFEATESINYNRNINFVDPCGANPNGGAPLASQSACALQPGFQASTYGSTALVCPDAGCLYRTGAVDPKLGPQTANTLTYGLVLTPRFLPRFSLSIDRYEIRYTNQIVELDQDTIVNNCIAYATDPSDLNRISCQQFIRNGNGTLFGSANSPSNGYLSSLVLNVPNKIGTTGYDFQAHYDLPVGSVGSFATDFNGGLVTSAASVSNQSGSVGYFGDGVGNPIPKWRHNLRATLTGQDGQFQISGNWRYISATRSGTLLKGQVQNTFARIPAYSYFDLAANVSVAKRMTLGVAINNLLDKDPPIIPARGGNNSYSINGWQNSPVNFYDVYGRYIQFSVSANF